MVLVTAQDGSWGDTTTWSGGVVPTVNDDVIIEHNVTFNDNINAMSVTIGTAGSLTRDNTYSGWTGQAITAQIGWMELRRTLDDVRPVNFDGVVIKGTTPCISCRCTSDDGFPRTVTLFSNSNDIIIDDPGFISCSAEMQDIKPEGIAHAYVRKMRNMVRYMTVTVKIKNDKLQYLASLYNMVRGPFQVLAVTHSCIIKGHIETVVPDASSVGKAYISVRVTIAEGPGA